VFELLIGKDHTLLLCCFFQVLLWSLSGPRVRSSSTLRVRVGRGMELGFHCEAGIG
jgi:hypothetical protein